MSLQKLHAFEKTAIQARHSIKRLEMILDSNRSSANEIAIAGALLGKFKEIRSIIPTEFKDVDLKDKE